MPLGYICMISVGWIICTMTCTFFSFSPMPKQHQHLHHTSSPDRPPQPHPLIKNSSGKVSTYVCTKSQYAGALSEQPTNLAGLPAIEFALEIRSEARNSLNTRSK
jgi:hypothetical protein